METTLSKNRARCSIKGCKDYTATRHRFPLNDPDRFFIWCKNVKHPKFDSYTREYIYKRFRVCRRHFEPKYFVTGTKLLHRKAIPTLNLPHEPEFTVIPESLNIPDEKVQHNPSQLPVVEKVVFGFPHTRIARKVSSLLNEHCYATGPKEPDVNNDTVDTEAPVIETDPRCRICLSETDGIPMNHRTNIDGETKTIFEILSKCCITKISINDKKPQTICIDCVEKAKTAYDFNIRCEKSDLILQEAEAENAKNEEENDNQIVCYIDLEQFERIKKKLGETEGQVKSNKLCETPMGVKYNKDAVKTDKALCETTVKVRPEKVAIKPNMKKDLQSDEERKVRKLRRVRVATVGQSSRIKSSCDRNTISVQCCRCFGKQVRFKLFTNMIIGKKRHVCQKCGARFACSRNFSLHQYSCLTHDKRRRKNRSISNSVKIGL